MATYPENAAAVGVIDQLMGYGRLAEAEQACRFVLARTPDEARAWTRYGLICFMRGAVVEAEDALRRGVELNPVDSDALNNLSALQFQIGKHDDAEHNARESIRLGNRSAAPWTNLGHIALHRKDAKGAAEAYRRAVAIDGNNLAAWMQLTLCEQELEQWEGAEVAFERTLTLAPQDLGVRANYGWFLTNRGQALRALEVLQPVLIDAAPAVAAWTAAGHARNRLGDRAGAAEAYRMALKFEPKNSFARHGLAVALRMDWKLAEAERVIRELLADEPRFSPGWVLLGGMQREEEAKASFRRALEINPKPGTHSGLLLSMQYGANVDAEALLAAHREWGERYARPLMPAVPPVVMEKKAGERIRLGFVSAGFCRHPVAFLGLPVLEGLDRERFEIACYSDVYAEDAFTERFKRVASKWRVTAGKLNEDVMALVKQDEIDILFDLGGHTEDRLLLFARKPAALQVSWLGYVGTTGVEAVDCLLADRFHVRPGEEDRYIERVLGMPNGYVCYEPPADAPEVTDLPAVANGYVTFGSFNNPAKVSSLTLDVWGEVLRNVPESRLFLKYGGFDQREGQGRIVRELGARGIVEGRLMFSGWSEARELLRAYGQVDLGLDTMPYSGGLTTCEALWMGVPVITYPGKTFASRHATSHLMNAGLPQFVAEDRQGYVRLAVEWAEKLKDLAVLRGQVRERVKGASLCDVPAFARDFGAILDAEWSRRATKKW